MASTCKTVLDRSAESRHPCLVPDLKVNDFSFSVLEMMFAVGLSIYGLYYTEDATLLI